MVMQIVPVAILRSRTAPSGFPLSTVRLARGQRPPAGYLEIKFGAGFPSLAAVAGALREVAAMLECGPRAGGIAADMEEEA
jgi:hypothetical protein